jgi:enoyl-CoA hydratase/carnithine racemase
VIDLDRDGAVFVLRMRAGENKVNPAFLRQLNRALDHVEASQGGAALVTTGEGRFYSTGLDLAWLAGEGAGQARALLGELHTALARLLTFPMVTVAAINGHAFAGGALLALAHDVRVMRADRGFVCMPEVDLRTGRPLTDGMYALLSARLPAASAHEALVTGRRYGGPEALQKGFVQEAVAEGEVLPRAVEIARELASKDRATLGALKRGLFAPALEALARGVPSWVDG